MLGLAYARVIVVFKRPVGNLSDCQARGQGALKVLGQHLQQNDWLALGRPTIADLACYPYVALAEESGIPLDPYTARLDEAHPDAAGLCDHARPAPGVAAFFLFSPW